MKYMRESLVCSWLFSYSKLGYFVVCSIRSHTVLCDHSRGRLLYLAEFSQLYWTTYFFSFVKGSGAIQVYPVPHHLQFSMFGVLWLPQWIWLRPSVWSVWSEYASQRHHYFFTSSANCWVNLGTFFLFRYLAAKGVEHGWTGSVKLIRKWWSAFFFSPTCQVGEGL